MCCNTDLCPNVGDWKFDFSSGNAFFGIDTASGLEPSMLVSCVLPEVALRLNQRPRKTPGFQTPASKLHASVASTVSGTVNQALPERSRQIRHRNALDSSTSKALPVVFRAL